MKKYLFAGSAIALLSAVPAQAAEVIFTDRTAFDAATGAGLTFESFETEQSGATVNYPGFSVTESNGFDFITHTSINSFFTSATSDGANSIWFDDNGSSLATFVFDAPINAFGFDVAAAAAGTMTFSGGAAGSFALGADTPTFFGLISDTAFTTLQFDMSGGPEVGFDALSFGIANVAAVPEPATWAFMIFGFGAIGGALRRNRKANVKVSYA
ncbi:MAG: PEPxxWA-CTERM sorting domain-containing protein [Parasphingorhabdus sp.]|uniref:PEPxxWA-CTERM sorting domain-containing protein n=1 Tax=Parasphingorhabdus sp. TaxID=2709688 RepID=UPI0032986E32